jgi:hypothetical protein
MSPVSFFSTPDQKLGAFLRLMKLWSDLGSKAILLTDNTKNADELVDCLLGQHNGWGGTDYDHAIKEVKVVMESHWSPERYQTVPNSGFILLTTQ